MIMALGVIFLLKAGSEQGLFGPNLRIGTAIVLSVLMVVGGEWLRRSRFQLPLVNAGYIPAALSGPVFSVYLPQCWRLNISTTCSRCPFSCCCSA